MSRPTSDYPYTRHFLKRRLFHRLVLYMASMVFILTFSFTYVSIEFYNQTFTQTMVHQMESDSTFMTLLMDRSSNNRNHHSTSFSQVQGLRDATQSLQSSSTISPLVLLIDPTGRILFHSQGPHKETHFPHLQTTTSRLGNSLIGSTEWAGTHWIVVESKLHGSPNTLVLTLSESELPMRSVWKTFLWLGLTAVIVGWILVWLLSRWLISPLRKLEHAAYQLQLGIRDISVPKDGDYEISVLSDALLRLAHILRTQEQDRKVFFTAIAHELRTPITYITGYSAALREQIIRDPAEQVHYINLIHDESLRLTRLVEDLILVAQAEAGQFRLELRIVEPNVLLQRVFDKFESRAAQDGMRFVADWNAFLPEIVVDEQRIEQLLFNLLENSLRYAERLGTVTLSAKINHPVLTFTVSDEGPGMPESVIELASQPFFRGDRSQQSHGMGLGLTVVREIVKAHGGEWFIQSVPGTGTRVTVSLPIYQADQQEME